MPTVTRTCCLCGKPLDYTGVLVRWRDPNGDTCIAHVECADAFDAIVPPLCWRPWWER